MSPNKTLMRDPQNRVLGGVCSGIANYFGWDPTLIRIAFALSLFLSGAGFVVYIILWVVMPEDQVIPPQSDFYYDPQGYNPNGGYQYPQQYGQPYGSSNGYETPEQFNGNFNQQNPDPNHPGYNQNQQ